MTVCIDNTCYDFGELSSLHSFYRSRTLVRDSESCSLDSFSQQANQALVDGKLVFSPRYFNHVLENNGIDSAITRSQITAALTDHNTGFIDPSFMMKESARVMSYGVIAALANVTDLRYTRLAKGLADSGVEDPAPKNGWTWAGFSNYFEPQKGGVVLATYATLRELNNNAEMFAQLVQEDEAQNVASAIGAAGLLAGIRRLKSEHIAQTRTLITQVQAELAFMERTLSDPKFLQLDVAA